MHHRDGDSWETRPRSEIGEPPRPEDPDLALDRLVQRKRSHHEVFHRAQNIAVSGQVAGAPPVDEHPGEIQETDPILSVDLQPQRFNPGASP